MAELKTLANSRSDDRTELCIRYFAEVLPNIGVLRVILQLPPPLTKDSLSTSSTSLTCATSSTVFEILNFPFKIIPSRTIISTNTENSYLTDVKVHLESPLSRNDSPEIPFSAQILSKTNLRTILCKSCSTELLSSSAFMSIKNLPSEHWLELLECWNCHENPKETEGHHGRIREITAQKKHLFVGNTYFLVHPEDVLKDSVRRDIYGKPLNWTQYTNTKWLPVICANCSAPLGEGLFEKSEALNLEEPSILAFKLSKYLITLSVTDLSLIRLSYAFKTFVFLDFLEAIKAHANYRFVIHGRRNDDIYMLIWLFNLDTMIMHNGNFENEEGYDEGLEKPEKLWDKNHKESLEKVMKILYIDCTGSNSTEARSFIESWQNDKSTEQLVYPDANCTELLNDLRKSTLFLPKASRKMQEFTVGFLGRD